MQDNSFQPRPEFSEPEASERASSGASSQRSGVVIALGVGLLVALGGDAYLSVKSQRLQEDIARVETGSQAQISKLGEETAARIAEQQRLSEETVADRVRSANDNAAAALRRARAESDKRAADLSRQIADTHTEVASNMTELSALKDTTNSKFTAVSSDVDQAKASIENVKSNAAATQTQVDNTTADLKRVVGDMGVMSGLIATNGKDLDVLRALGERNYIEFNLNKSGTQRVGGVTLTLKKVDAKHNRYTMDILADDKHLEKRDKSLNEPVQLYVGGGSQPYEIVVNSVKKDQVSGYLSTPKMKLARR